jgi:prevent-host-death family protein
MARNQKHPTLISATDLNRRSGELLKRVTIHGEHFLIERNGYPLAVIISIADYNRYVRAGGGENLSESEEVGA